MSTNDNNNLCKQCNHPSGSRCTSLFKDFWNSADVVFSSHLTWLFAFGPIALVGDQSGVFNEFTCFILAGLALIPCAERLSFVTEQVAAHTNQTLGALLNATFGNAPEFLISSAALTSGFYRVVQLTLLGSIMTNLLFVFGVSCIVGGLRFQVQQVKMTSGNVSVGLLLVTTAGLLLPAALKLSNQITPSSEEGEEEGQSSFQTELMFSRVNAVVMLIAYMGYLYFQIKTHRAEFEDDNDDTLPPGFDAVPTNIPNVCTLVRNNMFYLPVLPDETGEYDEETAAIISTSTNNLNDLTSSYKTSPTSPIPMPTPSPRHSPIINGKSHLINARIRSRHSRSHSESDTSKDDMSPLHLHDIDSPHSAPPQSMPFSNKSHSSDGQIESFLQDEEVLMPLGAGIVWLLAITLCISAMSDILVDTIDGFAQRCHISQMFTSVVIIPFFSNIAEQVSAVLFAYRNKMDLVVGVTVGSAIQISLCVIPGCAIIGWVLDRSMSLFFEGYETCCLIIGVLSVSAVLQGGTTNWLVGIYFVGIYVMIAAGFWFHIDEDLSIDAELSIHNATFHNQAKL